MGYWAVLNGDVVEAAIVADSKEIAETATGKKCVEYTEEKPAGIGWTYDAATGIFTEPTVE